MSSLSFLWMTFLLSFASCSVGPAYVPPCIEVPSRWKNQTDPCGFDMDEEGNIAGIEHWWEVFEDETLNELEGHLLENNRNLFIAWQRIEEARGLMGIAAADFYPQLTLNPQYTATNELFRNYGVLGDRRPFRVHELFYFLPLNINYEVDLWGKIRDRYLTAEYDWESKAEDFDFVMLSMSADLATAYFQLRAADTQTDLLLITLKTREKAFEINQARYEGKIIFYADVTLAGEEVENVRSQYYEILRQRARLENQIAILLGTPASEFCLEHLPLEGLPPCIPQGLPSEMLLRRPDIAEAELTNLSQHFSVKEAYTLFFPSLPLTAAVGYESPTIKDFLSSKSRYSMYGAQLNQIVFDGGRTCSNLDVQIARFNQSSGAYQQQVLTAFQEVEDALGDLEYYGKQYESTQGTVAWAQKSYELYRDRYTAGLTYYIDVVNTERDLLNYQVILNQLRGFRYIATVQFIRALGGGWSTTEPTHESGITSDTCAGY